MKDKLELLTCVNLDESIAYERLLEIFLSLEKLPIYTVPILKGSMTYRSRQNEVIQNFNSFAELSYPPLETIKFFNRANRPFQNSFYSSDSWETNITELMPNWFWNIPSGEVISVTCGHWEIVENLSIVMIPDFKNKKMEPFIEKAGISQLDSESLMLLGYINQIFSEDSFVNKNIYKITSAFCNTVRTFFNRTNVHFDGILYTSAQDKTGYNLALNPIVIDERKVILKNVIKHFIYKSDNAPTYDNHIPPIKPLRIDFDNERLIWI